ncbi:MAG: hypothetical protein HZC37_15685 [Burkholderiales bacterium]|nr:hypothetical protein [Burkholderiales bacterium]
MLISIAPRLCGSTLYDGDAPPVPCRMRESARRRIRRIRRIRAIRAVQCQLGAAPLTGASRSVGKLSQEAG